MRKALGHGGQMHRSGASLPLALLISWGFTVFIVKKRILTASASRGCCEDLVTHFCKALGSAHCRCSISNHQLTGWWELPLQHLLSNYCAFSWVNGTHQRQTCGDLFFILFLLLTEEGSWGQEKRLGYWLGIRWRKTWDHAKNSRLSPIGRLNI